MPSPADLPESLDIPPLAMGLLYSLAPQGPREIILARQAAWAAAHILNLIGDSPAEPDAKWLRLHNTADRILHRNLRLLDRLASRRPVSIPAPALAATTAPTPAPPPAPSTPPAPATNSPSPRQKPATSHRRPDVFRRPRPNLDLSSPFAASAPLPISATPSAPPG
jgi:hypothetical protein